MFVESKNGSTRMWKLGFYGVPKIKLKESEDDMKKTLSYIVSVGFGLVPTYLLTV